MTKISNESMGYAMWYIGQLLSVIFGIFIAAKYGFEAGLAVGYALLVLVDIRFNTTNLKDNSNEQTEANKGRIT